MRPGPGLCRPPHRTPGILARQASPISQRREAAEAVRCLCKGKSEVRRLPGLGRSHLVAAESHARLPQGTLLQTKEADQGCQTYTELQTPEQEPLAMPSA